MHHTDEHQRPITASRLPDEMTIRKPIALSKLARLKELTERLAKLSTGTSDTDIIAWEQQTIIDELFKQVHS